MIGERAEGRRVEHPVVALAGAGVVLPRVVDDVIGPQRAHELQVPPARHAGHLSPERLRDLHREHAHAARGPVDQHPLAADLRLIAKPLQSGERRRWHRRRPGEAHPGGLARDRVGRDGDILGERPEPNVGQVAEDLVGRLSPAMSRTVNGCQSPTLRPAACTRGGANRNQRMVRRWIRCGTRTTWVLQPSAICSYHDFPNTARAGWSANTSPSPTATCKTIEHGGLALVRAGLRSAPTGAHHADQPFCTLL
jgi:hypothetical protein